MNASRTLSQLLHASCPTGLGIPRNACIHLYSLIRAAMVQLCIQSPSNHHHDCVVIVLHHVARCCNSASKTAVLCFLSVTTPHHIHIHGGAGPLVRMNSTLQSKTSRKQHSCNLQSTSFQNAVLLSKYVLFFCLFKRNNKRRMIHFD